MNLAIILIMIVYAVLGGLSTLVLFFGIPAIIIWKFYRKAKFNIALVN
ncbi:hypothetical protein [Lachnoclostridium edouardi]|nr:hypothetical protein [Lachnoclostridium edouardi]